MVLLHGRGSHELDVITLAAHRPAGPAYAAVRAPIAEGGGCAWFANRGIGRPRPESLRSTLDWFTEWLDVQAPEGRPVTEARLTDLPVFVAQGEQDAVIPRELLDGTWGYLTGISGATTTAVKLPGGHGISARAAELPAIWTADRPS